jgi:tetratricopeptide (TPR) repeat protein
MTVWVLTLLGATALFAADEQQLALALKAQIDFDRVELAAVPQLKDTSACVLSQAAVLPVTAIPELPLIHFRKGYCTLTAAALTRNAAQFTEAAAEFEKGIEGWFIRPQNGAKSRPVEPVSSGLYVLSAVSRLQAAPDEETTARAKQTLVKALNERTCASTVMSTSFCGSLLNLGKEWLGRIALQRGELDEAAVQLAGANESGWSQWASGKRAFRNRSWDEAVSQFKQAIAVWEPARRMEPPNLIARIRPVPELSKAFADLGAAQLLAGDRPAAIVSLNQAAKEDPSDARSLFLRARAKELSGQMEGALTDYNLASRNAFAAAKELASGEAHLYRGILLFRRKDFPRAEDEFGSALNFEIPVGLRADAVAWRHMSAVAAGSCDTSRQYLERALETVTPYFPKDEARTLLTSCRATTAGPAARGDFVK